MSKNPTESTKQQTSAADVDENGLLYCYNKGCGQRFNPTDNKQDSCLYHPGPPYFHDAYKIWKCCDKKSTDFSTWLSYKGCTKGMHNPEKPQDEQQTSNLGASGQQQIRPENNEEIITWSGLNKPAERPVARKAMNSLQVQVTEAAEKAIRSYFESLATSGKNGEDDLIGDCGTIPIEKLIGASCKNNACKSVFTSLESDSEECVFHSGVAVFHEGMKFWSCCERKTTDFGTFLNQEGCCRGKHCWTKKECVDVVREDWFQRGGQVLITLYCKGALPEGTLVETDGLALNLTIKHGFGDKETKKNYELFGEIVPDESMVLIGERKVELILKQASKEAWPKLCYDDKNVQKL